MARRARLRSVAVAAAACVLAGCFGLPRNLIERASLAGTRIAEELRRVESAASEYEQFRESADYALIGPYAEREEWIQHLEAARGKVQSAESIYKADVLPIVEEDSSEQAQVLINALDKINPLLAGAQESAREWVDRRDFLKDVAERPDELFSECESSVDSMKEAEPGLNDRIQAVRRDHASRREEIDSLVEPLTQLRASADELLASARQELSARESSGGPDLAVLGDSCTNAATASTDYLRLAPEVGAKLAELDRSYSRTLIDMKVEYELGIRRESWDESRDYPQSHFLDYRVSNVSAATFEHLAAIRGSLVRSYRSAFFRREPSLLSGTDPVHWNALGIDLYARWPRGDNRAEYWVETAGAKYFHKYLVQENAETRESEWTEVSEDLFAANVDNLGMDVESKPYGAFDSEKLTHASPPGMAYVGNPRYGRWTSDGSGGSIWSWAGPYLFYSTLFGSTRSYGRSEWESWNGGYRGSRPYYGGSASAPKWGTRSDATRTSPRMQGSTFARGGGFRRPPATVRGAGPRTRSTSFGASGK